MFLIMSDTDSMNFLIAMAYTQLFNLLCEKADDVYGGRLPVHVRCLIDEAANIGQIPRLEKLVATIRSVRYPPALSCRRRASLKPFIRTTPTRSSETWMPRYSWAVEPTTLKERRKP